MPHSRCDGGHHFGEHIHVVETGGAAAQHFGHRQSAPARTKAGSTQRASVGQIWSCSQAISGRSSASPRSKVMLAWVWTLTRPGIRTCVIEIETNIGAGNAVAASSPAAGWRECGRPGLRWCGVRERCSGSTGTIQRALSRVAMACGIRVLRDKDGRIIDGEPQAGSKKKRPGKPGRWNRKNRRVRQITGGTFP
jgi:hypothetical protein